MDEYKGNEDLKKAVFSWLNNINKPQAILLKGTTGGGKTSMARIVAKEYLCEDRDEEKGACGECYSCKMMDDYIETGNTDGLMGLREINASKDSGLTAINSLLEEAQYPNPDGSWKIYILDECHRISIPAQNSLLKLVEEPPENVLFMFCTTDPDKMLDTLLNRCNIKLDVKKPSEEQLTQILLDICVKEGISYDRKGLSLIVDRSELVIRQALMDLENVIVQTESAEHRFVSKIFDKHPNSLYFDFYRALLKHDTHQFVSIIHKVKTKMTVQEFVKNLTNFTKRGIYIWNGVNLEGITENELKNMKELFKQFKLEELAMMIEFLTTVSDGDVEVNLLLLGFKGLEKPKNVQSQEEVVIEENKNDIEQENKVISGNKKAITEERKLKSIESVKNAVETATAEEVWNLFDK
ncbi:DNA polymerase III subunit gamma/tau [Bacillus thuringiensis IBL 4222]|nr:DNA polymerase III subunit gamma/tau [Bacillus thuringiensis serovar pondicheriensis BGSC 4BA1]EEM99753.1 DNA polymerase III subunit gamma/tau [Bacillus thuringiensis IBL 4222]